MDTRTLYVVLCGLLDNVMFEYEEEMRLLTSISGTFALNVHMAPLPVLFQGAALLIAPTAVVALEGLLYCKTEFQSITKHTNHQQQ